MITFKDFGNEAIYIGKHGENIVESIDIDCTAALQIGWGAGLLLRRPSDSLVYPATATLTSGILHVVFSSADTQYEGTGEATLIITGANGEVKKSATATTVIEHALSASGTTPSPVTEWTTAATQKLSQVDTAIETMLDSTIVSADGSVDSNVGTPSVTISRTHQQEGGYELFFAFANMKGNGISSVVQNASNELVITFDNGSTATVNGLKSAYEAVAAYLATTAETVAGWAEAEAARALAETGRSTAETARVTAETARVAAETLRESTTAQAIADMEDTAIVGASATVDSNVGTPSVNVTRQYQQEGGYNLAFAFTNMKGETGNVLVATFDIDLSTGQLVMTKPDGYAGINFAIVNNNLEVQIN